MSPGDAQRIARNEEAIRSLRDDIHELRDAARDDHHRLRAVEAAVQQMIDAQNQARQGEERQYRRLELRIQVLTVVVACATFMLAVAVAVHH